jgi:hypothetical protein
VDAAVVAEKSSAENWVESFAAASVRATTAIHVQQHLSVSAADATRADVQVATTAILLSQLVTITEPLECTA